MIVLDTSAALDGLLAGKGGSHLRTRILEADEIHVPHLIDIELLNALRLLLRAGRVTADRARDVHIDFRDLPMLRYPHHELAERIWDLRDNATSYDAAYLVLAEALGIPLVTCDAKLAAVPGHRAEVEVFAPG